MAKLKDESQIWKLYLHTIPKEITLYDYDKYYVGITSRKNLNDRWQNGEGYSKQIFYMAIKKYGWENIKHEILLANLTFKEAQDAEIEYIKKYDSMLGHMGYNQSPGGNFFQRGNPQPVVVLENGKGYANRTIATNYENISGNHICYMLKIDWCYKDWENDKWEYHYCYLKDLWRYAEKIYGMKTVINSMPVVYLKTQTLYPSIQIANKLLGLRQYHGTKNILTLDQYIEKQDMRKLREHDYMFANDYFQIFDQTNPIL